MSDLLSDDGMIVTTHVTKSYRKSDEILLFDRYFDVRELEKVYHDMEYKCPGYVYTKKDKKRGILRWII